MGGELRVLLVLATSTGGIGTHVRALAAGLANRGLEVTVAGSRATEDTFGFTSLGVDFRPVEIATVARPVADTKAVATVRAVLMAMKSPATAPPVVVHAHGLRAGLVAGLAVRTERLALAPANVVRSPLVVTWHNAILGGGPKRLAVTGLERAVARMADVTLGASYDLVRRAREFGAKDARLGQVAAPPLGPPNRSREEVRNDIGAGDRPIVLAVGRLAPQKAYGVLLDAAARLRARTPVPLVLIAGEGPLRPALESRIDTERLPARLLGHRDDVPDLLGAADVVASASEWEARSLVAQEALRCGRPLVATAVGGIPDLVGDAALLVPYNDPVALAGAIARILDDPELAQRLSAAGPPQAKTWPDEDATIEATLVLYRELTSRPALTE
jgi:glycosyltransferase involved in cell wall biosynthesis